MVQISCMMAFYKRMDKQVKFLTTSIVYYNVISLFYYCDYNEAWNISLFTYKVDHIKAIGGGSRVKNTC